MAAPTLTVRPMEYQILMQSHVRSLQNVGLVSIFHTLDPRIKTDVCLISVEHNGPSGHWGITESCPDGSFVTRFRTRSEHSSLDKQGITGIAPNDRDGLLEPEKMSEFSFG